MYTASPEWTPSVRCGGRNVCTPPTPSGHLPSAVGGFRIRPTWGQSDFSFESWFPISKMRKLNGGRGSFHGTRGSMASKGEETEPAVESFCSSGRRQAPGLGCTVSPTFLMVFTLSVPGSLAVSVADMTAPVVGSSGGVYALVSAHLANIVMVSSPCSLWICPVCPLPSLGLDISPHRCLSPGTVGCPPPPWLEHGS